MVTGLSKRPSHRIPLRRNPMRARKLVNHPLGVEAPKAGVLPTSVGRVFGISDANIVYVVHPRFDSQCKAPTALDIARKHGGRQAELCVIGDRESMGLVSRPQNGQERSEALFLGDDVVLLHIDKHVRGYDVLLAASR